MLTISQLFIYPIKSLGGIEVDMATLSDRGFVNDRRWMLVDNNNHFLTQREYASMALLRVSIAHDGLCVTHHVSGHQLHIPLKPKTADTAIADIWDDQCEVQFVDPQADKWFSEKLATPCRLVYMPDSAERRIESKYAIDKEIASLSDGYPLLMIGQSSLDDLNSRMEKPLPINRFRPNIVFTGSAPFAEDTMQHFKIGSIDFYGVKLCARCPITTIDQDNATKAKEPLRTLATYRMWNNKVYFGQNVLFHGKGTLQVGDVIVPVKEGNVLNGIPTGSNG